MQAVIADGGKQYLVKEGDTVLVEKKELSPGSSVTFDQVLSVSNGEVVKLGDPYVKEASVVGKVKRLKGGPKLIVFKFRRRKSSSVRRGHRQKYTEVQITKINSPK